EVPFLRTAHFDDHANISDVTIHALHQVENTLGETFETVAMLQASCPLRNTADVRAAVEAFEQTEATFQMSCFKFIWMNPWWSFKRDHLGRAEWLFPELTGPNMRRSQD